MVDQRCSELSNVIFDTLEMGMNSHAPKYEGQARSWCVGVRVREGGLWEVEVRVRRRLMEDRWPLPMLMHTTA